VTHPDGRQERLVHRLQMRCIFRFEAEHLLARAGFTVDHVYADFDRSAYGSQYPGELIFVARLVAPPLFRKSGGEQKEVLQVKRSVGRNVSR